MSQNYMLNGQKNGFDNYKCAKQMGFLSTILKSSSPLPILGAARSYKNCLGQILLTSACFSQ